MVVYSDEIVRVVWNESATFNVFVGSKNVDVFTCYDVAGNPDAARKLALDHIKDSFN
jgi:hypothetical protein